jgi:hypothetical protein
VEKTSPRHLRRAGATFGAVVAAEVSSAFVAKPLAAAYYGRVRDMNSKRAEWSTGVGRARGRARLALASLIGMAVIHATLGVVSVAELERGALATAVVPLDQAATTVQPFLHLVTAVLFLRWLGASVDVARAFQPAPPLTWTARQACWSFFIPFVNLVRPYQVIRDLHDRLAPDGVPEPAPRPRADGAGGYRRVEMEKAPPPGHLPAAWIGAWWAFYVLGGVAATMLGVFVSPRLHGLLVNASEVASATLAVLAVRAIDGRIAERNRRLQYGSDDELLAWGIEP